MTILKWLLHTYGNKLLLLFQQRELGQDPLGLSDKPAYNDVKKFFQQRELRQDPVGLSVKPAYANV